MMRTLILGCCLLSTSSLAAQGKLQQVRDAVNTPALRSEPDKTSDSDLTFDDDEDDFFAEFFGQLGLYIFGSPWWLPHTTFDAGFDRDGRFARYPFANPNCGFILIDRNFGAPVKEGQPPYLERTDVSTRTARFSTEYGSDFNGLNRLGLRLVLDTSTRFGLRTNWDNYQERTAGRTDQLWLSDVTATFRFVQNEYLQMHTGLGMRMLLDGDQERFGGNFLYSLDIFHTKPFHLGASFEAGWVKHAAVLRGRIEGGVNYRNLQLFAGYDLMRISDTNLHGPFVGLRLWY